MDYLTLVNTSTTAGSVANWLNSATLTSAAPTIIAEAESMVYRRLRHWKMLTRATGAMVIGNDYIAQPADYLEDKIFYMTGTKYSKMTRKTPEEVVASYGYDANGVRVNEQPVIYCNDQTNILFDSPADFAYPYLLWYYQQPAALSGGNTTNFLTSMYPRLMRCAMMASAAEFMKDSGTGNYDRTYWINETEKEIIIAQTESDRSVRAMDVGMMLG